MASPADICNRALEIISATPPIVSLDDETRTGRICKKFYDSTRRELIGQFPWSWATITRKLEPVEVDNPIYGYVYRFPQDVLKVFKVFRDSRKMEYDFVVETSTEGKVILTHCPDLWMRGIVDVEDSGDPNFEAYLTFSIALYISRPLKTEIEIVDRVSLERDSLGDKAMIADQMNQHSELPIPEFYSKAGYT